MSDLSEEDDSMEEDDSGEDEESSGEEESVEEGEAESDSESADEGNHSETNDSFIENVQQQELSSSSDEGNQRDRCPVCLNRFIGQDLGIPENCEHIFCFDCIKEWGSNINTCPIDRNEFNFVHLKRSPDGNILKKVRVRVRSKEPEEGTVAEDATCCEVCRMGDREHRLLLCDACDLAYHCDCLDPPLFHIPIEEWFCPPCASVMTQMGEGALPSASRSRRVIPRTRASESVRVRVQNRRTYPSTNSRTTSTQRPKKRKRRTYRRCIRKVVNLARTKAAGSSGKGGKGDRATAVMVTYRKKYKRRKRRKTKKTSRKTRLPSASAESNLQSAKERIAKRLGLCKARTGNAIPDVRSKAGPSSQGSSTDRTHSLFGARDQLMDFSENFNEDVAVPSTSSSTSRNVLRRSEASAAPSNFLDSILAGQELLHSKSNSVIIRNDGSLIRKEGEKKKAAKETSNMSKSVVRVGLCKPDVASKHAAPERAKNSSLSLLHGALTKKKSSESPSNPQQKPGTSSHNTTKDASEKTRKIKKQDGKQAAMEGSSGLSKKSSDLDSKHREKPKTSSSIFGTKNLLKTDKLKDKHVSAKNSSSSLRNNPSTKSCDTYFESKPTSLSNLSDNKMQSGKSPKAQSSSMQDTIPDHRLDILQKRASFLEKFNNKSTASATKELFGDSSMNRQSSLPAESNTFATTGGDVQKLGNRSLAVKSTSPQTNEIKIKDEPLSSDDEEAHSESLIGQADKLYSGTLKTESQDSESLIGNFGTGQFSSTTLNTSATMNSFELGDAKPTFIKKEPVSSDEESISPMADNHEVFGCRAQIKDEPEASAQDMLNNLPFTYAAESFEDLPCTQAVERFEDLSCTQAVESLEDLPCTQAIESHEDLPCTQAVECFENLPCTQAVDLENLPCTQAVEPFEDLPCTQAVDPFEDLPCTQAVERFENLPCTQAVECFEDLPCTQAVKPFEDLPCTQAVEPFEDLPCTQAVQSFEDLPCTKTAAAIEDLPCTQAAGCFEDLPCTQAAVPFEDLPCTQAVGSFEDLPCTQAAGSFEDLPCTQAAVPFEDLSFTQAAGSFEDLPCTQAAGCFEDLPCTQAAVPFEDLPCTQAAKPFEDLPCTQVADIFPNESVFKVPKSKLPSNDHPRHTSESSISSNHSRLKNSEALGNDPDLPATQPSFQEIPNVSVREISVSKKYATKNPASDSKQEDKKFLSLLNTQHLDDEELLEAKKAIALLRSGCNKVKTPPKVMGVHRNLPQVITSVPARRPLVPKPINKITFSFEQVKQHFNLEEAQKNHLSDTETNSKLSTQFKSVVKTESHLSSDSDSEHLSKFKPIKSSTTTPSNSIHELSHENFSKGLVMDCKSEKTSNNFLGTLKDSKLIKPILNKEAFQDVSNIEVNVANKPIQTVFQSKEHFQPSSNIAQTLLQTDCFTSCYIKKEPLDITDDTKIQKPCTVKKVDKHIGESNLERAVRIKREMNAEVLQQNTFKERIVTAKVTEERNITENSHMSRALTIKQEMNLEVMRENLLQASLENSSHGNGTSGSSLLANGIPIEHRNDQKIKRVKETLGVRIKTEKDDDLNMNPCLGKDKGICKESALIVNAKCIKKEPRERQEKYKEENDKPVKNEKNSEKRNKHSTNDDCKERNLKSKNEKRNCDKNNEKVHGHKESDFERKSKFPDKDRLEKERNSDGNKRKDHHSSKEKSNKYAMKDQDNMRNDSDKRNKCLVKDSQARSSDVKNNCAAGNKPDSKALISDGRDKYVGKNKHDNMEKSSASKSIHAEKDNQGNNESNFNRNNRHLENYKHDSKEKSCDARNKHGKNDKPSKVNKYDRKDKHSANDKHSLNERDSDSKIKHSEKDYSDVKESKCDRNNKPIRKDSKDRYSDSKTKNIEENKYNKGSDCDRKKDIEKEKCSDRKRDFVGRHGEKTPCENYDRKESKHYVRTEDFAEDKHSNKRNNQTASKKDISRKQDKVSGATNRLLDESKIKKEGLSVEGRKRSLEASSINNHSDKSNQENKRQKLSTEVSNILNSSSKSCISPDSTSGPDTTERLVAFGSNKHDETLLDARIRKMMSRNDFDTGGSKKRRHESMCSEETSGCFSDISQFSNELLQKEEVLSFKSPKLEKAESRKHSVSSLKGSSAEQKSSKDLKEEIATEVKLILKPFFTVGVVNKEDYKDIMRRAVPKVFLNCGNCVNPEKIKKLVLGYVAKLKSS